jgi:hypothetical protein
MRIIKFISIASACIIVASGNVIAKEKLKSDCSFQSFTSPTYYQNQNQNTTFGTQQMQGYGPQIGNVEQVFTFGGALNYLTKLEKQDAEGSSEYDVIKGQLIALESKIKKNLNTNQGNVQCILKYISNFKGSPKKI